LLVARDEDGIFCLKIAYELGTADPGRVFRSMASLIGSFTALDRVLEQSVGVKGMPTLLLEDIETGSLKTWLRNRLEEVPDEAIQDLSWKKVVGSYLVKGKRRLIQSLGENPSIESRADIARIQAAVREVAEETGVTRLPVYTPPDAERLLRAASDVSAAVHELSDSDRATYVSDEGEVKKPDYLGVSMWEFRHGEHPLAARIEDLDWLRRFQSRELDVRPGDSLKAGVRTDVRYGYQSEIVSVHHTILVVYGTERPPLDTQLLLEPPAEESE
jgi:8-oxo-dGTP pyrophosphatase MutT (NUDIX family)